MSKYSFLFFSLLCSLPMFAQQEMGLHFMDVWQANKTNPALINSDSSTVIGLVSLHSNLTLSSPKYGDLAQKDGDKTIININNAIANMEADNYLRQHIELQTLDIAFNVKNVRLSLSHAIKFDGIINYPKTLAQLIWQGNAQFIGETIDVSHDMHLTSYNEIGLGIATRFSKITVGVRAKYLSGIGNISNQSGNMTLDTDDDIYALTLNTDYQLNSSGLLDYNGFSDFNLDTNQLKFGVGKNNGFGFDAGIAVDLDKLKIAASVTDIGSINWTENVTNLSANGEYTYEGLDISNALTGDSVSFEGALDTIAQIFNFEESSTAFSTQLATKMYLSARYQVTDKVTIGGLYFSEFYREQVFTGFALSGQFQLKEWASIGATYSILGNSYDNIGLNAAVKLGPVQLYGATDHTIGYISPDNGRRFGGRVGLNLVF